MPRLRLLLLTLPLLLAALSLAGCEPPPGSEAPDANTPAVKAGSDLAATPIDTPASVTAAAPQRASAPGFVGSQACAGCHQQQHQSWQGSHHDLAMQHANDASVQGDFNAQELESNGVRSRFFRRDGRYFVHTAGAEGAYADFEVLYTFGTTPLQQYLVEFPGGRLQALPYAWDSLEQRWFDLHADLKPQPHEWVHWSRSGMNWNTMCADCHSTGLEKNPLPASAGYATHWAEIDVACEACHGPGQDHIEAVSRPDFDPAAQAGALHLNAQTAAGEVVERCGRCHARRQQLSANYRHDSDQMLDQYLPALLRNGLYHPDGQILDEVFVYGSFLQSRMYHEGVSCLDCHDPHSARLKIEGNGLCAQCHAPQQYDTPTHHHHAANDGSPLVLPEASLGNQCVDCHMPGRVYMGNDFRRDHSLRRPRPDLSVHYGTPNACNDCHSERPAEWAAEQVRQWFGPERAPHFSELLAHGLTRADDSGLAALRQLALDASQPAIARASALAGLAPAAAQPHIRAALLAALEDEHPLLRTHAARTLADLPMADKSRPLLPLLRDPVRAVRIAAVRSLSGLAPVSLPAAYREAWHKARAEYEASLAVNADFPSGQLEIGLYQHQQGNLAAAEQAYRRALEIDSGFNAARLNLAQLYYRQQRFEDAIAAYKTVIEQEPRAAEAHFSLGLLLAELERNPEAEQALRAAAELGTLPRAWFNLAVLQQRSGRSAAAEASYHKALEAMPASPEVINGLRSLYQQTGQRDKLEALTQSGG